MTWHIGKAISLFAADSVKIFGAISATAAQAAAIQAETEIARQEAERLRAETLLLKKEADAQKSDFAYKARQQHAISKQLQDEHKIMQTQASFRPRP